MAIIKFLLLRSKVILQRVESILLHQMDEISITITYVIVNIALALLEYMYIFFVLLRVQPFIFDKLEIDLRRNVNCIYTGGS